MSKMKHLLRKLHIGGGGDAGAGALTDHPPHHHGGGHPRRHNHNRSRAPDTASPAEQQQQQASLPSDVTNRAAASAATLVGVVESSDNSNSVSLRDGNASAGDAVTDFGLLEEEFQVQLALAMSASDSDSREDPETSAQIKAAQQISLGCCSPSQSLVDFQSLRYWNYDVVNYNEKVMDGFYDVYGINSNLVARGKMPSLVELQSIPVLDDHNYEVIIVDRTTDKELQKLEEKVHLIATEYQALRVGALMGFFVQKIANIVVEKMGGPVNDAEQMLRRWTARSYDLRILLNTVVLPLGSLDIGLSRQRALLFKVLSDRINLPCMLVKGSYYTSTDDGAFSIIRFDDGSEYIIDLMAAPGTLIPSEIPSSQLQNCGLDIRTLTPIADAFDDSCLDFGGPTRTLSVIPVNKVPAKSNSSTSKPYFGGIVSMGNCGNASEITETKQYGHEFGNVIPSLIRHEVSPVEEIQTEDISKLPLGNSSMQSPLNFKVQEVIEKDLLLKVGKVSDGQCQPQLCKPNMEQAIVPFSELQFRYNAPFSPDAKSSIAALATQKQSQLANFSYQSNQLGNFSSDVTDSKNGNDQNIQINGVLIKRKDSSLCSQSSLLSQDEQIDPVLGGVADWEIPWEDLQIGERIGIGSYGEVYRSDWNGTEVAVKKFMNQDISGDALVQFKCEVEIMLRLRHPNVVLFMGAVTRPPNLSILTEFLPRGSLFKLLHRSNIRLDENRRLRMALDVAKGMNYLHTSHPVIVHRDLKTPNLLVDKNWVVKVCDFGMSRMKHHTFLSSKSTAGTAEWMAPEVLRNEPCNEKSDVFSFGVILWELATLDVPWTGMNSMQVVGAVGFQGRRLTIPDCVDPVVAEIIRNCWDSIQHARPSFKEIISRLKCLERLVTQNADPETKQQ